MHLFKKKKEKKGRGMTTGGEAPGAASRKEEIPKFGQQNFTSSPAILTAGKTQPSTTNNNFNSNLSSHSKASKENNLKNQEKEINKTNEETNNGEEGEEGIGEEDEIAVICRVQAICQFKPEDQITEEVGEVQWLAFEQGDIIDVVEQDESGWWEGLLNGVWGIFPGSFVQVIEIYENEEDLESEMIVNQEIMEENSPFLIGKPEIQISDEERGEEEEGEWEEEKIQLDTKENQNSRGIAAFDASGGSQAPQTPTKREEEALIGRLKQKIKAKEEEYDELYEKYYQTNEQLLEITEIYEETKQQLDLLLEKRSADSEYSFHIEKLANQLETTKKQAAQQANELEKRNNEVAELKERLNRETQEKNQLKNEKGTLEKLLENKLKENQHLKEKMNETNSASEQLLFEKEKNENLENQISQLQNEKIQMNKELLLLREQIEKLFIGNQSDVQMTALQVQLDNALNELKKKDQFLTEKQSFIDKVNSENRALFERCKNLENLVLQKENLVENLENKIETMNSAAQRAPLASQLSQPSGNVTPLPVHASSQLKSKTYQSSSDSHLTLSIPANPQRNPEVISKLATQNTVRALPVPGNRKLPAPPVQAAPPSSPVYSDEPSHDVPPTDLAGGRGTPRGGRPPIRSRGAPLRGVPRGSPTPVTQNSPARKLLTPPRDPDAPVAAGAARKHYPRGSVPSPRGQVRPGRPQLPPPQHGTPTQPE